MKKAAFRVSPWIIVAMMTFLMLLITITVKAESEYPSAQGSAEVYPSMQGIDIGDDEYALTAVVKTITDPIASSVSGVSGNDLMFIQEWDIQSDKYPLTVSFIVPGTQSKTLYIFSDNENGWSTVNKGIGSSISVTFTKDTHAAVYVGPNLLTKFEISDVDIVEGTCGDSDTRWDEATQTIQEFYHYKPDRDPDFNVTAVYDGVTYSGSTSTVEWYIWQASGNWPEIVLSDDQWNEPWKVGKSYTANASFMGLNATYSVKIIPLPLESISVDPISITEGANTDLLWNTDKTDCYVHYNVENLAHIKIQYDGEEYSGSFTEMQKLMRKLIAYEAELEITVDQSYENQWVSGGTYQGNISLMGVENTFYVTIAESPFVSIKVDDISVIKDADTDMQYRRYYDDDGSFIGPYHCYSYLPSVTLLTESGEEYTCPENDNSQVVSYQGEDFQILTIDDQETNPWELGNHQATIYCGGLETTVTVTVVETPVENLQVDPVIAYEGGGVVFSIMNAIRMPYTVTFKDGTTLYCDRQYFQYNGRRYGFGIGLKESSSNWEAGNTYYITASFLGFSTDVPVHVYGIESLEVEENNGLTLYIHQTDGETIQAKVDTFYIDAASSGPHAIGYLLTDKGFFMAKIYNYSGSNYQNIQIEMGGVKSNVLPTSKWVETNKHAGKWFSNIVGQTRFNGIVNKDNIDKLILVTYLYGTRYGHNAGWNSDVLTYDADFVKEEMYQLFAITAYFDISMSSYYNAEKNVVEMPMRGAIGGDFDCEVISTDTEQGYITHSSSGPENDTIILFDMNYKIRQVRMVSDAPFGLSSVSVDDLTIYEGTGGNLIWNQEQTDYYYEYNLWGSGFVNVTAIYDGREYSGTPVSLENRLSLDRGSMKFITNQSEATPWTPGHTYPVTLSVNGVETTFNVTIVESPFVSMEVEDVTLIEDSDGSMSYSYDPEIGNYPDYFHYKYNPTIALMTKDGETVILDNNSYIQYQDGFFNVLKSDDQETNHWGLGTHQAHIYFAGLEKTINVTVVESPVASIEMAPFLAYEGIESSFTQFHPFTVTMKDGTTLEGDRNWMKYNGNNYELTFEPKSSSSEWVAGNTYSVKTKVLGFTADIPVKVYGIDSIEIQEDNGLSLVIHQTDGETVTANAQFFGGYPAEYAEGYLITDKGSFKVAIENYDSSQNVRVILGEHESNVLPFSKWMETCRHAHGLWPYYMGGNFDGTVTKDNIDALIVDLLHFSWITVPQIEPGAYDANLVKEKLQEIFFITADFDIKSSQYYNADRDTIEHSIMGIGLVGNPELQIISMDTEQGVICMDPFGAENDKYFLFDDDYKIKKMYKGEPHEHAWGEWEVVTEPTCTEEGMKRRTCSGCDEVEEEAIAALGHTWNTEYTVDKEAICTEKGQKSIHCSVCGEIKEGSVEVIPKKVHTPGEIVIENKVEATCTQAGHYDEVIYCTVCEEELSRETKTIAATGHSYGEWVISREPTCTEAGSKERVCSVCSDKETETIAAAHKWNSEYTIDKPATRTEEGSKSIHCSVCDEIEEGSQQVIPKVKLNPGWYKEDGIWYYVNNEGEFVKGWVKPGSVWYYMDPTTGAMMTGLQTIGGTKYYLDPVNGDMKTGWINDDGTWYYAQGSGALTTGWIQSGSTWYYMDSTTCAMVTGWVKVSGSWYYMKESGAMATGWAKSGNDWYYMSASGVMVTGWVKVGESWYYMKSSGAMAANEWCSGYWLNANGTWTYQPRGSWKQDSTGWWFGDTSGWYAKNEKVKIDGVEYTFDAKGYWVKEETAGENQ